MQAGGQSTPDLPWKSTPKLGYHGNICSLLNATVNMVLYFETDLKFACGWGCRNGCSLLVIVKSGRRVL